MKRMLSLAVGLSLAVSSMNANVVSRDEAVRLRNAAAGVNTVASLSDLFLGEGGLSGNEYLRNAQEISGFSYGILASALEEGNFHMKIARVLQAIANADGVKNVGLGGATWRVEAEKKAETPTKAKKKDGDNKKPSKEMNKRLIKSVGLATLKQLLKEAAHEGLDRLAAKQGNKLNNEALRRTLRATLYTAADSFVEIIMTASENSCYGRVEKTEKDIKDGNMVGRDGKEFKKALMGNHFWSVAIEKACQNAFFEIAGSMVAHHMIDEIPAEAISAA